MQTLNYYKKLLTIIILYDYAYDARPSSLFSSDLTSTGLLFRFLKLIFAFPLSLLTWAILRTIFVRYKVSIYVLKTFRPGFASTYLNMMEPICRQLQHENNPRHIKILVEPGESVSDVLVKSYAPHFTMYLDDRRKFARLIAYLIPKSGIEKRFLNTSNNFWPSWIYPPSKNYVNPENQVPTDLAKMGIGKENYVLFVHPSINYYQKRLTPSELSDIGHRFLDLTTYRQALEKILENNLRIVRVGLDVDELPVKLKSLPIIDYTDEIRNEASELWLYENCRFLLSVCNGAYSFARRFDRPSIITNNYVLIAGYFSTFFTPMTVSNKESGTLLSFAEMFELRTTHFLSNQFMKDHHLELLPNSSLTIANAVEEMLNPFNDKNVPTQKDSELMDRYKALLNDFNIRIEEKMTMPTISFLREYENLF